MGLTMLAMSSLARALALRARCSSRAPSPADAQYFGRNKVQYRTFDFKILKTEHFDFYYYPEEAEAAPIVARMAERWHARLSRFFGHELRGRQTVILYAAPAHFRQTNAIEGMIGEATGGVTEAIKRRIVLPMSGSLADTDHVLGHELVHAFQFDITGDDPRDMRSVARPTSCSSRSGSSRAWPSTCRSARSTRRRRCGCATRPSARNCRTSGSRRSRSTSRTAGGMPSGRSSAPSTAIAPSRR